jgi:ribonuclease P protein component
MQRLKQRADFLAAASGIKALGAAFVLQARQRFTAGAAESGPVRVGFTVTKKVGNAVVRNRVRRRLREVVRLSAAALLRPGHDYVLIGRRPVLEWPFDRLVTELDRALHRVHARTLQGTGDAPSGALHGLERRPPRH